MSKKYLLFVIIAIVIILIVGQFLVKQNNKKDSVETTKVRIGYVPLVHGLPLYLAIEKGYFAEEGFEVEAIRFEAPNQLIDALLAGQIDFGAPGAAAGITVIAESKFPNSMKIYAGNGSDPEHITDSILVKKDSPIQTIADLKGKKVGVFPGIQWKTISKFIFAKNNLSIENDITLVELAIPLQVPALASGQVDALIALEPVTTIANSMGISKQIVASPVMQYIASPFYGGVGNISVSFVEKNPNTTKKIVSILDKATVEINQNPDAARSYLKGYTPLDDTTAKTVVLPFLKMSHEFTESDIQSFQKFIDIFYEDQVIERKVDIRDMMYIIND